MKSGNLNFLEPSGPLQACNGTALPLPLPYLYTYLLTHFLTYLLTYLHNYPLTHILTYLLPYLLTPWSKVLLEKLTGFQLVKKFPAFYGTRMFITAVTSARHLSHTKVSVQVRGFLYEHFVTRYVVTVRIC